MSDNKYTDQVDTSLQSAPTAHLQGVPGRANQIHTDKLLKDAVENSTAHSGDQDPQKGGDYSLNDDRRVKVLSPGAMVAKRFFRNRVAIFGLVVLIIMFVFSFGGGLISPYREDQSFYRIDMLSKEYASAIENKEYRYMALEIDGAKPFTSLIQAQAYRAAFVDNREQFIYNDVAYRVEKNSENFFSVYLKDGTLIGAGAKDIFNLSNETLKLDFETQYNGLKAFASGEKSFVANGVSYTIEEDGTVMRGGEEFGYIGRYVVQAFMPDVFLSRDFKEQLMAAIAAKQEEFTFVSEENAPKVDENGVAIVDENGEPVMEIQPVEYKYTLEFNPNTNQWRVMQKKESIVYDAYSPPSWEHWLGTDGHGMDMLTRLMYGGRVSLMIGFIVEIIATVLAIILGGLAGYFGKWVDNLIMRIVDIFYCVPSMPIIIILGAAMDEMSVDPKLRMIYLMLILGFLGWPGVARMIRGLILSLREQEFMTATEACGISVKRRIFRHLIPNVIPQLIVSCTMGLGSTIITEATLSFLGLGVRFPFASWGNIISDAENTFVLTNYWFIWIPAGALLLLTVLAFNILGDGLRDAFDPKMKR